MSEINVNFNPLVVLDRLPDAYRCITGELIEKTSENISLSASAIEEKSTVMADRDQSCEPSQEQRPDESNDTKKKLDENESDVTLFNLEVGEIMQITDESETTNSSSNRNNTNVVLVLINEPQQQPTIEAIDSKESLAATVSNDSAYLSQSMEVIGILVR